MEPKSVWQPTATENLPVWPLDCIGVFVLAGNLLEGSWTDSLQEDKEHPSSYGTWAGGQEPSFGHENGGLGFDFLSCKSWVRQFSDVSCRSPEPWLWPGCFSSLGLTLPSSGKQTLARWRVWSLSALADVAATVLFYSQQTLGHPRQLFEETVRPPGSWRYRAKMERPGAFRYLSGWGIPTCLIFERKDFRCWNSEGEDRSLLCFGAGGHGLLPHPRWAMDGFLKLLSKLWLLEESGNGYCLENFPLS